MRNIPLGVRCIVPLTVGLVSLCCGLLVALISPTRFPMAAIVVIVMSILAYMAISMAFGEPIRSWEYELTCSMLKKLGWDDETIAKSVPEPGLDDLN